MTDLPSAPAPLDVQRFELHPGASTNAKAFQGGCLIAVMVGITIVGLFLMAVIGVALSPLLGVSFGIVLILGVNVIAFMKVMEILRAAAWLEGTELVVRSAFTTRRCDLATAARMSLDCVPETRSGSDSDGDMVTIQTGRYIPRLIVHDAATEQEVCLPLYDSEAKWPLDASKLHALAGAIMTGRGQGPDDQMTRWVVNGLYGIAADPWSAMRPPHMR